MKSKIFLFRTMVSLLLLCVVTWDVVLWLMGRSQGFAHRDALLTCTLIWIALVLFPQNSDDDFAPGSDLI